MKNQAIKFNTNQNKLYTCAVHQVLHLLPLFFIQLLTDKDKLPEIAQSISFKIISTSFDDVHMILVGLFFIVPMREIYHHRSLAVFN